MSNQTLNLKNERQQTKRVPFGVRRQRLLAAQISGYKLRWVNDSDDRLQAALDGGYTFVEDQKAAGTEKTDSLGSRICKSVGGGIKAYLMKIPTDIYEEDQAAKQQPIDAFDYQLKTGQVFDSQGFYKRNEHTVSQKVGSQSQLIT